MSKIIKYADKAEEYTKTTPGIGTDIFIRKKAPGAHVGEGYIVDIYENGVKTESFEVKTKKETIELIKNFKEKYNTDRAFQNEVQVHITYKTKEERGEIAMIPLDNKLLKQATLIQNLLQKKVDPELPLIVRKAQEELEGISSVPTTPLPGEEAPKNTESIKQYIVNEIVKKYTSFVKAQSDTGKTEIDEIFNPLRQWYTKLGDTIREWNNMSEGKALSKEDVKDIVSETIKYLGSKDPELITSKTGIPIDQETADLMAEIGQKSIGKKSDTVEGGELGGDPERVETEKEEEIPTEELNIEEERAAAVRTATDITDTLYAFEKQIQTTGTTIPIDEIAKNLNVDEKETIQSIREILSEKSDLNEAQSAIKKWADEKILEDVELIEHRLVETYANDFWRYASEYKNTTELSEAFFNWSETQKISNLKQYKAIWNKVNNDIKLFFSNKKALFLGEGDIEAVFHMTIVYVVQFLLMGTPDQQTILATFIEELENYIMRFAKVMSKQLVDRYTQHATDHLDDVVGTLTWSIDRTLSDITGVLSQKIEEQLMGNELQENQLLEYKEAIKSLMLEFIAAGKEKWNMIVSDPTIKQKILQIIQDLLSKKS